MTDILNVNTRLGKGIVSMLISNILSKKLGFKVSVDLDKLHIKNDGNTISVIFSGEATAPTKSVKF